MKHTSLICASVIALAAWTLTAGSALAAGTAIGPAYSESDCLNDGGTVVTDSNGNKICKPRPVKSSTPAGREPTN
jgi:hypothetical protein